MRFARLFNEVESHAADGLQIEPTYGADHRLESWNVAVSNDVMGRLLSDSVRTYPGGGVAGAPSGGTGSRMDPVQAPRAPTTYTMLARMES